MLIEYPESILYDFERIYVFHLTFNYIDVGQRHRRFDAGLARSLFEGRFSRLFARSKCPNRSVRRPRSGHDGVGRSQIRYKISFISFCFCTCQNQKSAWFILYFSNPEKTRSDTLQEVKGSVVTNAECMDDYAMDIADEMLCVSAPVQSACQVIDTFLIC